VDLSPYATSIKQNDDAASVQVSWHHQLEWHSATGARRMIEFKLDGQSLWWGIIDSINEYRVERGTRSLSITSAHARRLADVAQRPPRHRHLSDRHAACSDRARCGREPGTHWRRDAAAGVVGLHDPQPAQLADLSAWDMLETLYQPGGYAPFVDAHGRLKVISRDIARPPKRGAHRGSHRVRQRRARSLAGHRDPRQVAGPALTYVAQQSQVLAGATITAGFFVSKIEQDVFFSDDRSQRAGSGTGHQAVSQLRAGAGVLGGLRAGVTHAGQDHAANTLCAAAGDAIARRTGSRGENS
jgi:hypothetical protein